MDNISKIYNSTLSFFFKWHRQKGLKIAKVQIFNPSFRSLTGHVKKMQLFAYSAKQTSW